MTGKVKTLLIGVTVFLIVTAAVMVLLNVLFTVVPVSGDSMEPTIENGDRVFVLKVGEIKRGDVVVFYNSDKESEHKKLIKRVIALPGDTVETRGANGKKAFYVNGEQIVDAFQADTAYFEQPKITVREGSFYYLGDNREVSLDSRSGVFGSLGDVVGVVLLKIRTEGKLSVNKV